MPITFECTVRCEDCGARITIRDEAPQWHLARKVATELKAARQWVAEHPTIPGTMLDRMMHPPTAPPFVGIEPICGGTFVDEHPVHYIDCPCCGGKAFRNPGLQEEA